MLPFVPLVAVDLQQLEFSQQWLWNIYSYKKFGHVAAKNKRWGSMEFRDCPSLPPPPPPRKELTV